MDFTSRSKTEGLGPLNYELTRGINIHPLVAVTPEDCALGVLTFGDGFAMPG